MNVAKWMQRWLAEGIHGDDGGQQHDQQRGAGYGQVIAHFQGGLECQHADEMHGPDTPGQAKGTQQAPLPLGAGMFHMADTLGNVQGGITARARYQVGKQHQEGAVPAIQQNLPRRGQFREHM
ncbi:hypothetical protein D3C76_1190130 [compost metagenome]